MLVSKKAKVEVKKDTFKLKSNKIEYKNEK